MKLIFGKRLGGGGRRCCERGGDDDAVGVGVSSYECLVGDSGGDATECRCRRTIFRSGLSDGRSSSTASESGVLLLPETEPFESNIESRRYPI